MKRKNLYRKIHSDMDKVHNLQDNLNELIYNVFGYASSVGVRMVVSNSIPTILKFLLDVREGIR